MTSEPRFACCVCFLQWAMPGRRRCGDCDVAAQPRAQRPPKPHVDLSQGLPEDLSGYTLADFGIPDDT